MAKAKPVPDGFHTATPYLIQDDCAKAIDFYARAFGAEEVVRHTMGGRIGHAEVQVGDSRIMMSDEMPPMGNQPVVHKSPKTGGFTTAGLFLYVRDCDAAFDRAVKAGCTVRQPPADMFWGDRFSQVTDPFGQSWSLATHIEDVPPAEMKKRAEAFAAQMQGMGKKKQG